MKIKMQHRFLIFMLTVIFLTGFYLNTYRLIPKEAMWFMPEYMSLKHYVILEKHYLMTGRDAITMMHRKIGTELTPLILESLKNPKGGGGTIGIINAQGNSKTILDYRSTYIIKRGYWRRGDDYFYCYKLQNTGNQFLEIKADFLYKITGEIFKLRPNEHVYIIVNTNLTPKDIPDSSLIRVLKKIELWGVHIGYRQLLVGPLNFVIPKYPY